MDDQDKERIDVHQPTFNLSSFKRQDYEITTLALNGAANLGMSSDDIDTLVSSIKSEHFYKSMSSTKHAKIWQDVYRVPYEGKVIYLKISTGLEKPFIIVQLKEK